jgi:hypothetical protein
VGAAAISFPFSKHTGGGDTAPSFSSLPVCLQLMWEVGLPLSPVQFSSHLPFYKISCPWLLGAPRLPPEPLQPGPACLFTVPGRILFTCSWALCALHPLFYVSLLFLLLITKFLFFPRVEVDLSRVLCCSGPRSSVEVPCTTLLIFSVSSQAVWARVTGSPGALLVSPFNVKWRFSALAACVEGSKFCLFLVVLPARCVSSASPGFHCRRHAFCFLSLAAILISSWHFL